jgi:hypothetical protein
MLLLSALQSSRSRGVVLLPQITRDLRHLLDDPRDRPMSSQPHLSLQPVPGSVGPMSPMKPVLRTKVMGPITKTRTPIKKKTRMSRTRTWIKTTRRTMRRTRATRMRMRRTRTTRTRRKRTGRTRTTTTRSRRKRTGRTRTTTTMRRRRRRATILVPLPVSPFYPSFTNPSTNFLKSILFNHCRTQRRSLPCLDINRDHPPLAQLCVFFIYWFFNFINDFCSCHHHSCQYR